jgi:hypothetical protein
MYLSMTIGPMLMLLGGINAFFERRAKKTETLPTSLVFRATNVFGRVPMFYYIAHLYIGHSISWLLCLTVQGYPLSAFWNTETFGGNPKGSGFELWVSYVVWVVLIALLYPLCKWYDGYKTQNASNKFLRYL